jgi:hypothetical protein
MECFSLGLHLVRVCKHTRTREYYPLRSNKVEVQSGARLEAILEVMITQNLAMFEKGAIKHT